MAAHYYENIDRLKDSVTVTELVNHYGFEVGRGNYIKCPFHGEKTASLKVWDDHFKCFGCGAHGDVIKFVQLYQHLDFKQAMEWINREFGLGLPFDERLDLAAMRAANKTRARIRSERTQAERIRAQRSMLNDLFAECDRIVIDHPVPDTIEAARARIMRDYYSYLIDNFNDKEGYPDGVL